MFWLIGAIVASTAVSVGTQIAGSVVSNEQINKQIENQKDNVLEAAYVKNGTSFAPPPIRW
jgi:hypothetical protein